MYKGFIFKLVHWVERASFTKIRRLLEIFEQEWNHEVLLIVKNLHDLSRHPSPYIVPIIPHPLPSEIVESEHFVAVDLLSLISDGSSPARETESEAAGQELVTITQPAQPSFASEDLSLAPQASKQGEGSGCLELPPLATKDCRLTPQASKKMKESRLKVAGAGTEEFIPWVPPISHRSPDREEEEKEEDDMYKLVHNFTARKRKRDASLEQVVDAAPEVDRGSGQPCPDGVRRCMPLSSRVCLRWF